MMKKSTLLRSIFYWMFAAILTCGSTTVLTSCSDDEVEDFVEAVNLVGTWKGTIISLTPAPSSRLEFEMDGSVTFNANGTFVNSDGEKGEWSLRDKTISMVYTENGQSFTQQYYVQDGYTRDQIELKGTYSFPGEGDYNVTIRLTRVK